MGLSMEEAFMYQVVTITENYMGYNFNSSCKDGLIFPFNFEGECFSQL